MRDIMDVGGEICSLLEKKSVFFNQYLSITERMKESFVDKKETDPRTSISQRQACINKIQKIDASLEKIMGSSSDKVHTISEKCKGMIDGYLRSLKNIMETVDCIDRELIVMVGAEGENIKTELLKLQDVRQAAKGYRDKIESTPRFLDTIR
jgi:phage-related protein